VKKPDLSTSSLTTETGVASLAVETDPNPTVLRLKSHVTIDPVSAQFDKAVNCKIMCGY
jgi:hypothetical protein